MNGIGRDYLPFVRKAVSIRGRFSKLSGQRCEDDRKKGQSGRKIQQNAHAHI